MTAARRPRPQLNRRFIVTTALGLVDAEGSAALTFRRLGRALGADPTAVYRHFADKDSLLLAMTDELVDSALAGFRPTADWRETLQDLVVRGRRAYLAHPRVAALATVRVSRLPAEMRAVEAMLGALAGAGFPPAEAALLYRSITDFMMAWTCFEATYAQLDSEQAASDEASWTREYATVDQAALPHIAAAAEHLPGLDDDQVFHSALALLLDGLEVRALRRRRAPDVDRAATAPGHRSP